MNESVKNSLKKREQLNIRLTSDDAYMLGIIAFDTGKSKTEIIREALKTQYELHKYTH